MTYFDKLVSGVGVGVSADERGGEVGAAAVVSAAVGIEAFESEILLGPRGVLESVWLQKGDNVVFDRDVLAAADRQMLEGVDARAKDAPDEGYSCDCCIAEV
jgi:hypothetical protein